jgi:hypothetical protein
VIVFSDRPERSGGFEMAVPKYIRVKEGGGDGYTIDAEAVSNTSWGDVDKTAIKNKLAQDQADGVPNVNRAIKEVYAIVGSVNDKNTWKYPHHILRGNTVILNRHGLASAAGYLAADNTNPVDARRSAARHLKKHYRALDMEVPEGLNAVLESASGNQHADELISWLENMDTDVANDTTGGDSLASLV